MKISQVVSNIIAKVNLATTHIANTSNPHSVTKTQVGLGNVTNVAQLANTQTITHTGDVTSSATALNTGTVSLTLANSGVTAGTYKSVTVDIKGRVTAGSNPTTLVGYGITDAQQLDADLTAIAGLAGTTGLLKKTAADTWTLDTNTYVTSSGVTSVTGTAPVVSSGGSTPVISIAAATASINGYMTSTYASKLDGIADSANNYVHPANHAASIITQDANNRFVTDTEKSTWNGKVTAITSTTNKLVKFSNTTSGITNSVIYDDGANVGIGTSAPTDGVLHIHNASANNSNIKFTNSISGTTASDGMFVGIGTDASAYVYQREALPLIFGTSNTTRMQIDSTGDIRFTGKVADGQTVLYKDSTGGSLKLSGGNSATDGSSITLGGSTGGSFGNLIIFKNGATETARIDASSNLAVTGTVQGTQLKSTIATGTAPLTVASTTLVTNLNADLLDGMNSATANTASTIVSRDASGNFSAGTITAALTGTASTASKVSVIAGNETVIHDGIGQGNEAWVNYRGSSGTGITRYKFANGLSNGVLVPVVASNITEAGSITGTAAGLNGISYKTLDAVAKAESILTGGGTITVNSSWYVLWSQRFIAIDNGYGSHFSTAGYFDITCPTSGTITGVGGTGNKTATAAGIPLGAWESLYYILPIGSNSASVAANFRVVGYTSALEIPSTWIKICLFNQDANYIEFANGVSLKNNTSLDTAQFDVYDSYQANKLKNARSINGVNFDGTGNINTENVDYLSINDDVKAAVSTPGIVGFVSIGTSHSSQPLANDVNQLNNMMYTNGNSKNKLIKNSTFVYSHILSKTTSSTISTTYSTDTLKLKYKNVLEVSFSHFALAGDRADAYIYMLDKFGRMVASLFYYKSSSTWGIGNYTTISLSFYNPVTGQYLGGQSIDSTGFAGTTYGNGALDALIKLTGTQIQFYPMEKVANAYKYNTLKVFSLSAPGISLFENYPVERVYVSNYNSVTTYASGISSVHVSNTPGLLFGNALSTDCVDIDNTPVVSNSNKLVKALVGQSMYSGNAVMVEDGSIVTWGTNTGASLSSFGRGEPYADGSRLSIGQVMLPQSASSIVDASGFTHGGYILDAAKNLYLNGYNPNGILGYGNTNSKGIFDSVTRYGVVEVFGPKCIAYDHNATRLFTRDSNNKIYVTGYNGYGACGIGSTTNALSFTQVTGLDGYTIVKMWNLGGTYGCTFAWTNTGELLAAGYNGQGQLGTGNTTQQNSFVNVTAAWKLIAGWEPVDIFGGFGYYDTADHAEGTVVMHIRPVGSTTQGKVITCGNNQFGQLGDNTTVNKSTPIELTFSTAVTKFEAHGGGPLTCYAVTATNQLYTWGYNGQGQAGVGNTNSVLLPTLVRSDIEEVFARSNSHTYSYRATVFVKQVYSGKLFSCGENTYGQCGLGNTTAIVSSFTEVPFSINVLGHIIDVTCNGTDAGLYYTFLTSKGRVFGTGYNGRWGLGLEHNNAAVTTLTEIRI